MSFRLRVSSKHPTHHQLRGALRLPFKTRINFGRSSTSALPSGTYVLINHPIAVAHAADKFLMKQSFVGAEVRTAKWWPHFSFTAEDFPLVLKHRMGSRGTGVYLMRTQAEYQAFATSRGVLHVQNNFIVEKFHSYTREYRVHATPTRAFLCHRKGRKDGVPVDQRWKHSYENSVWFNEDNPLFFKPATWDLITAEACKAVAALGLDFGAVDIKTSKDGSKFFIIEVNSAPSVGEHTREAYLREIPIIAQEVRDARPPFTK